MLTPGRACKLIGRKVAAIGTERFYFRDTRKWVTHIKWIKFDNGSLLIPTTRELEDGYATEGLLVDAEKARLAGPKDKGE